ncbi:glucosylceramidase [Salegentibacter sp. 24]|nr:glucosylceramidase [Salegentibacter sp. 24]
MFSMLLVSGLLACNQKEAEADKASLWLTTLDKESLLEKKEVLIKDKNDNTQEKGPTITIDTSQTFQEMDGFGYTLTGGSALHLNKMSDSARSAILQELFGTGKDELGVSYLRLSIGASDLDKEPFSYNDLPKGETDVNLENFSLANDTLNLIPVVKEILKIAPEIKILGSPWSPPVWMKDNKGTRGGSLMKEYYPVYANYFVKYIEAMKEQGIIIDAITIQNEPLHPGNNPSMLMLAENQAAFIKDHLGPLFAEHNIDTKIILYDHNADRPDYPISILNDPEVAKYVDGSAFHLYGGEIEALSEVHKAHPDKNLYFTEQWVGAPGDFAQEMSWHTKNLIIGAPRNWSKNVLEWNLAADENQEPHTDRGGCDRCLGAITIDGNKVIREPAYYIIGQASKFVRPGSVRVASNEPEHIANVAYLTPDGEIAIILQNTSEKDQSVNVELGNNVASVQLPAGAVGTLVM